VCEYIFSYTPSKPRPLVERIVFKRVAGGKIPGATAQDPTGVLAASLEAQELAYVLNPQTEDDVEAEYLIKWEFTNYRQCTWESVHSVRTLAIFKLRNFEKLLAQQALQSAHSLVQEIEHYQTIERILAKRGGSKGQPQQYLVKWEILSYDNATWESVCSSMYTKVNAWTLSIYICISAHIVCVCVCVPLKQAETVSELGGDHLVAQYEQQTDPVALREKDVAHQAARARIREADKLDLPEQPLYMVGGM
jgi:hypothetical protein